MDFCMEELIGRYPRLVSVKPDIQSAYDLLKDCFAHGGTLYLCGNGGSASDCEHIAGELMKSFRRPRPLSGEEQGRLAACGAVGEDLAGHLQSGLRAVALTGSVALSSAITNDMGSRFVFAQQIWNYGQAGDVLLCVSTSGNSENVCYAAVAARARGLKVLLLSGRDGGKLKELSDVSVICPAQATEEIQELHLPIYHALCAALEEHFWGTDA